MAESKKHEMPDAKSVRHIVEEKIAAALAEYKEQIGEKRFNEKVEKAAKIIAKSIVKHPIPDTEAPVKKVADAVKKTVKKITKTVASPGKKAAAKKAPAKKAPAKKVPVKKG